MISQTTGIQIHNLTTQQIQQIKHVNNHVSLVCVCTGNAPSIVGHCHRGQATDVESDMRGHGGEVNEGISQNGELCTPKINVVYRTMYREICNPKGLAVERRPMHPKMKRSNQKKAIELCFPPPGLYHEGFTTSA